MNVDEIGQKLLKYPNVTGYSKKLRKRIKDGKVTDELCIQVHVKSKLSKRELKANEIIPDEIDGVKIDVVRYGKIEALARMKPAAPGKKNRIRPLVAGISVGNRAITAGTLGWFMQKTTSPDQGEIFLGSNAHVLVDEPKNPTSSEKSILQPGRYDGGRHPQDQIGEYYWHKQITPEGGNDSGCTISNGVAGLLNNISSLFSRQTRFAPIVQTLNQIDFAVARMSEAYLKQFVDAVLPPANTKFAGFGFAGGDTVSCHSKASYVLAEGYYPEIYEAADVQVGDKLLKTGRTSCFNNALVVDDSAYEVVDYGSYLAPFDDIILTGKMLDPGDSGSAVWLETS